MLVLPSIPYQQDKLHKYTDFADNSLNKHHKSVLTEGKKRCICLNHTEKCIN